MWFAASTAPIKGTGLTKVCEDIMVKPSNEYEFNGHDSSEINYFVGGCSSSTGAVEYDSSMSKCSYGTLTVDGEEVYEFSSDSYDLRYDMPTE